MEIKPDTHRKFSRIHFDRQVNLKFVSDRYEHCQIKNLCLAGMFVLGDFGEHEGKNCTVDLVQTEMFTKLSLQASAKVVRKNDEGIAIEFTSMTFDSYLFLQVSLLNERAEDSLLLGNLLVENCPFEIIYDLSISSETNTTLEILSS